MNRPAHLTTHHATRRLLAATLTLTLVVAWAAPAAAKPLVHDTGIVSGEEVFEGCDFPILHTWEARENLLIIARGKDRLPHFQLSASGTNTWVDAENPDSPVFLGRFNINDRDQRITVEGDLLRIEVTVSFRSTYYLDGQKLLLDAGQSRFVIYVDHGGTPTDPSDDEFVEDGEFLRLVGRSDIRDRPFCDDMREFLRPDA
jgi:hypothetical protein